MDVTCEGTADPQLSQELGRDQIVIISEAVDIPMADRDLCRRAEFLDKLGCLGDRVEGHQEKPVDYDGLADDPDVGDAPYDFGEYIEGRDPGPA